MPILSESPSASVERALAILEAVAHRAGGLNNAEISRKLGIPKSSASYILRTLERHGYLRREHESGKYRVGLKVLSLSRDILTGLDIRGVALPAMRELVRRCNLTCHLAILDGAEAVYIEKVESEDFIQMHTWIGRRIEVHTTGIGKALVAYMPEKAIEAIVQHHGLKKITPRTITSSARFLKELEKVRKLGYALDDEENSLGVRCVAAPIFNEEAVVEAAVSISGTVQQIDANSIARFAEMVKDAARRISHQLGYRNTLKAGY